MCFPIFVIRGAVRAVFPDGDGMRKTLTRALYLVFVDLVFYGLVVHPVSAFQVSSSTTGYVRVASQAAVSSMVAAQRAATLSSVASLVSTSTAGSIGVRLVAGSLGWPALGIVAGITLAMLYYDATKTAQLKAAATPSVPWSIPGFTNTLTGPSSMSRCSAQEASAQRPSSAHNHIEAMMDHSPQTWRSDR